MTTMEDSKGLVKKLITSVLVSNPSQSLLTIPDLDRDYQQHVGEVIPYSKFAYSTLEDFLADIPDILKIEVIGGSKVLRPVVSVKVEHIHKLISKQKKPTYKKKEVLKPKPRPTCPNDIPFIIRSRLKNLIKGFKNGLVCSELPGVYKACYKKELNYQMFKYPSLLEMCRALKSIFTCIRVNTGEVILQAVERNLPVVPKQTKAANCSPRISTPIPTDMVPGTSSMVQLMDINLNGQNTYPFNVLQLDETIPCQFLESHVQIHDFIDVCVTEIYDPSKFWMTLHKYSSNFQDLHINMQSWYSRCTDLTMDEKHVQYGMFCSAPYSGEFYRAMVVKLLPEHHFVKVFFVDYGTVTVVDSRNLMYLHKSFSHLPQQAIRARLGEIHPIMYQSQWTNAAFEQFINFVTEKVLIAEIVEINFESEIVEVKLRADPYSMPINDSLVHDGKAFYTNQVRNLFCVTHVDEGQAEFIENKIDQMQRQGTFTNIIPSVDYIHLYPTFNEIEQAVVPSSLETTHLLKFGFSYDYLFPHYYIREEENVTSQNNSRGVSIYEICCP